MRLFSLAETLLTCLGQWLVSHLRCTITSRVVKQSHITHSHRPCKTQYIKPQNHIKSCTYSHYSMFINYCPSFGIDKTHYFLKDEALKCFLKPLYAGLYFGNLMLCYVMLYFQLIKYEDLWRWCIVKIPYFLNIIYHSDLSTTRRFGDSILSASSGRTYEGVYKIFRTES